MRTESLPPSAMVMRKAEGAAGDPEAAVRLARARSGTGMPLDPELRPKLEAALGERLDGVRIHTGADADAAARAAGTRAFTLGDQIFFRDGGYDPTGREGRRLIAHEIARRGELTQAYLERRAAAYAGLDPAARLNAIVDEILSVPPIAPVAHHFWRHCLSAVAETVPSEHRGAVRRSVCKRIRRRYTVTKAAASRPRR